MFYIKNDYFKIQRYAYFRNLCAVNFYFTSVVQVIILIDIYKSQDKINTYKKNKL